MEFLVDNLNDSGTGSLRWAIDSANGRAGFDTIQFSSALAGGTISLSSALATISDRVAINGLMGTSRSPGVAVDFNNNAGLVFRGNKARNSSLKGLALVDASGDGLTLDAARITVQNTYLGVALDGVTGIANRGNGLRITSQSHNNLIGTLDSLTGLPLAAQVSNLISANAGSGIVVEGSRQNRIANNRIGTNAAGTADLGNGAYGIHLTSAASNNTVGGTAHQGNNPTQQEFARPGQGNLISGNASTGVLIDSNSTNNTLSGNFIGTDSLGTSAIANDGDGVAIINADRNVLRGTTRNQSPFIYYNVVSGNGGNGLRVLNSDNVVVHANFFGLGADNNTIVANGGDGALIEGNSRNTQYGGVIPLGNVNAGNRGNGLTVKDQVYGFISFNTFAGLTAFGGIAPNQGSGMHITTTGGKTWIRTNVISGNLRHGLHITGSANDVWVDPNIIGLDSYGTAATYTSSNGSTVSWANGIDGVRVDGQAQNIRISGRRQSVIPQNTISNNTAYGIRLLDQVNNVLIDNSYLGLGSLASYSFGNQLGGLYADAGVTNLKIGTRTNSKYGNRFSNNLGNGITLAGVNQAQLYNNLLATNTGSGVAVNDGTGNSLIANVANQNQQYGFAFNNSRDSTVDRNRGSGNGSGLYNF